MLEIIKLHMDGESYFSNLNRTEIKRD